MFSDRSRYRNQSCVAVTLPDGRTVKAVTLRKPATATGTGTAVKSNDRLDIMAQRGYDDPTRFWRIADANTELKANDLVDEVGRSITVPEQA